MIGAAFFTVLQLGILRIRTAPETKQGCLSTQKLSHLAEHGMDAHMEDNAGSTTQNSLSWLISFSMSQSKQGALSSERGCSSRIGNKCHIVDSVSRQRPQLWRTETEWYAP